MTEPSIHTDSPPAPVTVLFADISGSTSLYERHGDLAARGAIAACLEILDVLVTRFGGRVAKTIGDEVMAVFDDPGRAVMAAGDMQVGVRTASEQGQFETGPMHIKIGLHHGPGEVGEDDVLGEASIVAQQLIKLAKADQILTSEDLLSRLPPELNVGRRHFDTVAAEGRPGTIEVVEVLWEISELTQVADTRDRARQTQHRLSVCYDGQTWQMDRTSAPIGLGRVAGNDVVVPTDLTSRNHAEIRFHNGSFHVADNSSNGTVLVTEDGRSIRLRREGHVLRGKGHICLGGTPEDNPSAVLTFVSE